MNRLEIWITIIKKIQNFVGFRPLKAELSLKQSSSSGANVYWSFRNVCLCSLLGKNGCHRAGEPWIENLKSSAIANSFVWFFLFLNDHFLLFILASVAANFKAATESDVLKVAGVVERW